MNPTLAPDRDSPIVRDVRYEKRWAKLFRQAAKSRFGLCQDYRTSSTIDALHPFYSFNGETRRWLRAALNSRSLDLISYDTEKAVLRVMVDWEVWIQLSEAERLAINAARVECERIRQLQCHQ